MPIMVLFGDNFGMLWNLSIYLGTLWELRIICWHIISIATTLCSFKFHTIIRILTLYRFVLNSLSVLHILWQGKNLFHTFIAI